VHVALVAPPVLNDPAGHASVHSDVRPVPVLYIPATHAVQVEIEAPPVLNDPAGHSSVHSDVRPVPVK
jgi:hypothetical protein